MNAVYGLIIRFNNWLVRLRNVRVEPESVLLLLPHCLQRTACPHKLIHDMESCERCGQCDIAGILALRDELKIKCSVVSGGREALRETRDKAVRVIVAIACEKELFDGIRAAFPKPVLAVSNKTPNGPCRDTVVSLAHVKSAIREVIEE